MERVIEEGIGTCDGRLHSKDWSFPESCRSQFGSKEASDSREKKGFHIVWGMYFIDIFLQNYCNQQH